MDLTLASQSASRARLLRDIGLQIAIAPANIDEHAITQTLVAEGANPRDIADTLAEYKARKVSSRLPGLVLGADQVLDHDSNLIDKASDPQALKDSLGVLAGTTHRLHSAMVLYENGEPIWRHVSVARLTMRPLSAAYIERYVDAFWDHIRHCVGGYRIEAEGVRLFSHIQGDLFTIQGLPVLPLQAYLVTRGVLSE